MVSGDSLYIGVGNELFSLDIQSHEKRWEFKAGGTIRSSPALVDTILYVASGDGYLHALDAATGEELWSSLIGGEISSSPAVADGIIYIGSHDGNLYAIE